MEDQHYPSAWPNTLHDNLEGQLCIQGSEILSVSYQNMVMGDGWSLVTTPPAFLLSLSSAQFCRPLHIQVWLCWAYVWVLSIPQGESCSLIWDLGSTEQDTDCPRESRPREPLTDAGLGLWGQRLLCNHEYLLKERVYARWQRSGWERTRYREARCRLFLQGPWVLVPLLRLL